MLGATILDKRRYALDHLDHLRKLLIFEPRGHYDMYGVVPVEPDLPGAHFAVLFLHNEGYSTMCGHATIALGRYIIDQGLVPVTEPLTEINLQCPCGMVLVRVAVERTADGLQTGSVSFESVPSFAFATERVVDVAGLGSVTYDIGYGGAFYAVVAAPRIGFDLETTPLAVLVEASAAITEAVKAGVCLEHPDDPELAFLYGTILTDGRDRFSEAHTRNVCVFADREVDRSPTGSGVSARIALQVARGDIAIGQARTFESLTGATFEAMALRPERVGPFPGVRVQVSGRAHYTGRSQFIAEPDDPLRGGFLLR